MVFVVNFCCRCIEFVYDLWEDIEGVGDLIFCLLVFVSFCSEFMDGCFGIFIVEFGMLFFVDIIGSGFFYCSCLDVVKLNLD